MINDQKGMSLVEILISLVISSIIIAASFASYVVISRNFDFQKEMNIPTENQFAMVNFENGSKKWVLTMLNKGIIIDKNGLIKEGFGIFTSDKFEEILYNNYR